ncbi:uncharacterized protein MONBRDRAFT_6417 [Monosiga brevicollis MX1]|uniref:Uncharacterized protein n=1 Tax=Monosiga brevicollis TaxID=81824 RepID=A9UTT5_MONBE|nr:uncharacterized protein MONBRDRAFT_6417 [Monosiga brevicollis MX1]EDQ91549.1 predicted protein [Monosiga brevicollis MX1]|eukprot:XP_001743971.1 hypothetical protein [Monosiga brevicollis MX1]
MASVTPTEHFVTLHAPDPLTTEAARSHLKGLYAQGSAADWQRIIPAHGRPSPSDPSRLGWLRFRAKPPPTVQDVSAEARPDWSQCLPLPFGGLTFHGQPELQPWSLPAPATTLTISSSGTLGATLSETPASTTRMPSARHKDRADSRPVLTQTLTQASASPLLNQPTTTQTRDPAPSQATLATAMPNPRPALQPSDAKPPLVRHRALTRIAHLMRPKASQNVTRPLDAIETHPPHPEHQPLSGEAAVVPPIKHEIGEATQDASQPIALAKAQHQWHAQFRRGCWEVVRSGKPGRAKLWASVNLLPLPADCFVTQETTSGSVRVYCSDSQRQHVRSP